MAKTWRERFEIALKLRGETQEHTDSIPVSDKFKQHLLELTMEKVLDNV